MKIDSFTFNTLCQEVAENTQNNNHTNAKLIVAIYFKLTHYIKVFKFVEYMHIIDGSMFTDLGSIRTREGKRMMLEVENILSQKPINKFLYKKLQNSF